VASNDEQLGQPGVCVEWGVLQRRPDLHDDQRDRELYFHRHLGGRRQLQRATLKPIHDRDEDQSDRDVSPEPRRAPAYHEHVRRGWPRRTAPLPGLTSGGVCSNLGTAYHDDQRHGQLHVDVTWARR